MLRRFAQPARTAALSSDGRLLALAGTNNVISVVDTATGLALRQWPSKDSVWSLSFLLDDRGLICTGWSRDALVCRWDDPTPHPLSGHDLHVWSAAVSPDGATIATTSSDQTVRLWDADTLKPKGVLRGHQNEVWCVAFCPKGDLLATGGKDQNVMLWRTERVDRSLQLPHDVDFRPIFSADGKSLLTVKPQSKTPLLWNAQTGALLSEDPAKGQLVTGFSRDGSCVASFDPVAWRLNFWPPGAVQPVREVDLDGKPPRGTPCVFAALSPDQEVFFAIDGAGMIFVWNADSGHLLRFFQGPAPPIRNVLLSPHGKQLAVSVESQNVAWLFDCATGRGRQLPGHRDFVSGLAFSPDGSTLATGSEDGTIRLWNTTNGNLVASLPGHLQETTDVAFSPDGRTLASLGRAESLKLWHLPTLREVVSQNEPHAGAWLRFAPDGGRLAFDSDTNTVGFLSAPSE
jgi:WD40 repeat protein